MKKGDDIMPLKQGKSQSTISANVRQLINES